MAASYIFRGLITDLFNKENVGVGHLLDYFLIII